MLESQRLQPAQRPTAGLTESEVSNTAPGAPELPPPPYVPARFYWTGRDITDTSLIAMTLGVVRKVAHGEALIESSVDLQDRPPRLTDAWRFFHAAALLRDARSAHAARAQSIGARIALAVTGWMVTDMVLAEMGSSAGLGMYIEGHPEQPVLTAMLDADGLTAIERWKLQNGDIPRPMGAR